MRIVLTSVGYADFLSVTLAAWQACIPSWAYGAGLTKRF